MIILAFNIMVYIETSYDFHSIGAYTGDTKLGTQHSALSTYHLSPLLYSLEGAARYAGLLLAPAEGFGLRPRPGLFMSVLAQILVMFGDW